MALEANSSTKLPPPPDQSPLVICEAELLRPSSVWEAAVAVGTEGLVDPYFEPTVTNNVSVGFLIDSEFQNIETGERAPQVELRQHFREWIRRLKFDQDVVIEQCVELLNEPFPLDSFQMGTVCIESSPLLQVRQHT